MTKTAINTRTQEEYDALMRYYESNGITAPEGKKASLMNFWPIHQVNTSVLIEGGIFVVGNSQYHKAIGIPIIPFTEFAKANIVEEPDYKALYLEGRELLEKLSRISKDTGVAGRTWGDTDYDSLSAVFGYNLCLENIQWEIKAYLTKHNTPNRDEEYGCVFLADTKTTSATKCTFCGKEKFEHFNHPTRE